MQADLSALFGWRCQAPEPEGVCGGRLYACAGDDLAHVELYCGASLYSPSRSHRVVLPRPLPDPAAALRAAVELHRQRIRSLGHHPTHGAGNPWDRELWAALDGTAHSGWEQFRGQIVSVHSSAVVVSVPPVVVPPARRPPRPPHRRTMTADEGFNREQRIVIALLAASGTPNPERVVAADRLTAAKVGAALMPIFETLADSLAGILASVSDALDVLEEVTVEAAAEEVRAGLAAIEHPEPSDE